MPCLPKTFFPACFPIPLSLPLLPFSQPLPGQPTAVLTVGFSNFLTFSTVQGDQEQMYLSNQRRVGDLIPQPTAHGEHVRQAKGKKKKKKEKRREGEKGKKGKKKNLNHRRLNTFHVVPLRRKSPPFATCRAGCVHSGREEKGACFPGGEEGLPEEGASHTHTQAGRGCRGCAGAAGAPWQGRGCWGPR